jgi:N-acetylglucosamine-6-sulfatase
MEVRTMPKGYRNHCLAGTAVAAFAVLAGLWQLEARPEPVPAAGPTASRPNIVFILMDDVRWDDVGYAGHPFVATPHIDRIAAEGVRFANAFASTPLCSPVRASILTGQYAHTHGIVDNVDRSALTHKLNTFPRMLHEAGYETAFIGKWHMGVDDTRRPGFDYWIGFKGQGEYFDPEINDNGANRKVAGYMTDILTDFAVEFVSRERESPFLVYLSQKAVHPNIKQFADASVSAIPPGGGFTPAPRHRSLYAGEEIPRRPNTKSYAEGKPALERKIEGLPPLGPATGTGDDVIRNRLRMLTAADEGIERILEALEETNQLNNTVIVFTSDHGYFYGEHGLNKERRLAYEESARVPLAIRYPELIGPNESSDQLVLSIDLAPTLLELGGVEVPGHMQGVSLVPLLKGKDVPWRESILIEYFSDTVWPRLVTMGYQAVRTERWKYIHYTELEGMDEFYDLQADPYEMNNVIADPAAATALEAAKTELQRLLRETGAN